MHLQATEIEPILHKALALDPADRFEDAMGFCRALEAVDVEKIPVAQWDPSALLVRSEQTTTGISARDTLLQTGPTFPEPGAASVSIMMRTPWRVGGALDGSKPKVQRMDTAMAVAQAQAILDQSAPVVITQPTRSTGPWIVAGAAVLFAGLMALLLATALVLWPNKPALAPTITNDAPAGATDPLVPAASTRAGDKATAEGSGGVKAPDGPARSKANADRPGKPALADEKTIGAIKVVETPVEKKADDADKATPKANRPASDSAGAKRKDKTRKPPRTKRPPRTVKTPPKKGTERPRGLIPD